MSDSGVEQRHPSPDTIYVKQNQLFGLFPQYEHAQKKPIKMGSNIDATLMKVMPLVVEGGVQGQVLVLPYKSFAPPLSLRIELNDLADQQLQNMECAAIYAGQLYVAKPNIESIGEGEEKTIISYGQWLDEKGKSIFTENMDRVFLKTVRFLVRDKTQHIQGSSND